MWNKEMRKREILKSMKFTANFIHKQWLLKKSVLSLARKVNRNMTKRVVEDAAVKRLERFRVRSVFEAWLKSNRDKLEHKLTELKGYKASYRTCLKLGFKKFLLGFDILHCQNSQLQKAITYNTQKTYEKTIYSWLLGIREYRRKQIKHQKAFQFYRSNLQAYAFDVLSHIIEQSKLKNDNIIDEFDFKLKKKVIEA